MIERFLFDGINAITTGAAISRQHNLVVMIAAHETQSALTLMQLAIARADITLHAPVVELVPVTGRDHRG